MEKETSARSYQKLGRGWFLEANDTAASLASILGKDDWCLVELMEFYHSSKGVEKASGNLVRAKFGGDKRVLAPKTMAISRRSRVAEEFALFSGLNGEMYDQSMGYAHQGVNLGALTNRQEGECSLILPSHILANFTDIVLTDGLQKTLARKSVVCLYSLGDQVFFAAISHKFLDAYASVI